MGWRPNPSEFSRLSLFSKKRMIRLKIGAAATYYGAAAPLVLFYFTLVGCSLNLSLDKVFIGNGQAFGPSTNINKHIGD